MKKHLNNTRGETIVEIVVAFLLLMLFTAIFTVALRYAQSMKLKTEQLREVAFQLCGQVYPLNGGMEQGDLVAGKTKTYTFSQRGLSGMTFTVEDVTLHELPTEYTDSAGQTHTYTFRSYGSEKGETP